METTNEMLSNPPLQPDLTKNDKNVKNNADIFGIKIDDPRVNRSMYDSRGKYFDSFKFNAGFDEYINQQTKKNLLNNELKTHDLNNIENQKVNVYNLPLKQILINIQTFWFKIYDNIQNGNNLFYNCDYNDFLYVGITLIVVVLLYIILFFIFE